MTEEAPAAPATAGRIALAGDAGPANSNGSAVKAECDSKEADRPQESSKPQRKRDKPSLSCETCTVSRAEPRGSLHAYS